jgi:hypothetical protein
MRGRHDAFCISRSIIRLRFAQMISHQKPPLVTPVTRRFVGCVPTNATVMARRNRTTLCSVLYDHIFVPLVQVVVTSKMQLQSSRLGGVRGSSRALCPCCPRLSGHRTAVGTSRGQRAMSIATSATRNPKSPVPHAPHLYRQKEKGAPRCEVALPRCQLGDAIDSPLMCIWSTPPQFFPSIRILSVTLIAVMCAQYNCSRCSTRPQLFRVLTPGRRILKMASRAPHPGPAVMSSICKSGASIMGLALRSATSVPTCPVVTRAGPTGLQAASARPCSRGRLSGRRQTIRKKLSSAFSCGPSAVGS